MKVYGKILSTVKEIPEKYLRKTGDNFLIGEGGIYNAYLIYPEIYEDKVWVGKVYLSFSDFNKNTLILGAMGTGKSNLLKYLSKVFEIRGVKQVIHDVKGEYVESFYDEKNDLIYNIYDKRGFFWDFVNDFKRDSVLMHTCLKSMIMSYMADVKDLFWVEKGVEVMVNIFNKMMISSVTDKKEALSAYEEMKEIYKQMTMEVKGETETSAVAVASPCLKTLLNALYIYGYSEEERLNLTLADLYNMDYSRMYLVFIPEFSERSKIFNTGLLTALFLKYLSRGDVTSTEEYVVFILDEYLSFNIPRELEVQTFTMARSKGICLVVAVQYLPGEERRKVLTNSRYYTFAFRVADLETAMWLSSVSGEIDVDFDVIQFSDFMNLSVNLLQDGGVNTSYSRIRTHNIPYDAFMGLEKHVAFLSIEDRYKFFVKPVWYDIQERRTTGFLRDEITYNLPE